MRLAGLLDWHCRSHLPEYVGLLRSANATLAAERVEAARLEPSSAARRSGARSSPSSEPELRVLLAGLSAEQVEELATPFARRGEEARAEFSATRLRSTRPASSAWRSACGAGSAA